MKTIEEAMLHTAALFPDKAAVIDKNGIFSYRYVTEQLLRTARFFAELGLRRDDRILVECTQKVDYLVIGLACHYAHMVFVPVEMNSPVERVKLIFDMVEPSLCIYGKAAGNFDTFGVTAMSYTQIAERIAEIETGMPQKTSFDENELSELLYTTGTTGTPKGIMISHGNNAAVAENIICATEMASDSVELIPLPLSHSHGLRTAYANLMNGSTIVLFDGVMDAKAIYNAIGEYGINTLDLSPSAAKILLKLTKGRLGDYANQIKAIELGTALLDEETKENLKKTFPASRLYNFYGSTEAGRCCCLNFNSEDDIPFCIGYPSKNAQFIVCGPDKAPIESSAENPGLLAVAGSMNMLGYWRDEKTTAETIRDNYIYTSDLAYIDGKGRVFVLGRADDVINYKGIKISPEEIEVPAMSFGGIADCAAIAVADKLCGQVPKLFIQPNDGVSVDTKALIAFLKERLDDARTPKYVEVIDTIPRSGNGKLLRKQLRGLNHA